MYIQFNILLFKLTFCFNSQYLLYYSTRTLC